MEFTPDDFKRMMFNVYEADMSKSFLTQFPELNVYEEFSKRLPTQLDGTKLLSGYAMSTTKTPHTESNTKTLRNAK